MQASQAYNACMQYTLRNVPPFLDEVLRQRAREERKSLNQVTIDALLRAFGLKGRPVPRRDLSDIVGTWEDDPIFDEVLEAQRKIDPEMWQ